MFLSPTKQYLLALKKEFHFWPVYNRFREFTMISEKEYVDCLQLVKKHEHIPGCVVECGVWRGGMSAGMATVLGPDRNYFLFDSFAGLPPAKEIDGEKAIQWQKDTEAPGYYENCKAEITWAEKAMAKSGAKNVRLIKGWFDQTIPGFKLPEPIAVLRLDGDWYDSIMTCLDEFFPLVPAGGLIIMDDYHTWEGCSKALHDYLSKHKRPERIKSTPSMVGYLIKS